MLPRQTFDGTVGTVSGSRQLASVTPAQGPGAASTQQKTTTASLNGHRRDPARQEGPRSWNNRWQHHPTRRPPRPQIRRPAMTSKPVLEPAAQQFADVTARPPFLFDL